jgi:hypothetical protein
VHLVVQLLKSQNPDEARSNADMYATLKTSDWYSIFLVKCSSFSVARAISPAIYHTVLWLIKALFLMFTSWDYCKFAIVVYKTWCLVLIIHFVGNFPIAWPVQNFDLVNNLMKKEVRIVSWLNMAFEVQGVLTAAILVIHLLRAKP